jgi:hypothetical protein
MDVPWKPSGWAEPRPGLGGPSTRALSPRTAGEDDHGRDGEDVRPFQRSRRARSVDMDKPPEMGGVMDDDHGSWCDVRIG